MCVRNTCIYLRLTSSNLNHFIPRVKLFVFYHSSLRLFVVPPYPIPFCVYEPTECVKKRYCVCVCLTAFDVAAVAAVIVPVVFFQRLAYVFAVYVSFVLYIMCIYIYCVCVLVPLGSQATTKQRRPRRCNTYTFNRIYVHTNEGTDSPPRRWLAQNKWMDECLMRREKHHRGHCAAIR